MSAHQVPPRQHGINRLRVIREHVGVSQADMAQLLGIKRQTLSRVETGKQPLPDYLIARILTTLQEHFNLKVTFTDLYRD